MASNFPPNLPPPFVFPNFDQGLGRAKKGLDYNRENYVLGVLGVDGAMFSVASIGAGVVSATIQDIYVLPCRAKIPKIAVFCSAIDSIEGGNLFNIVSGFAAYETTQGVQASGTYTFGGTPTTGDTATATINGTAITPGTITTGQTTTQLAALLAANINANTAVNGTVFADANAAVVTVAAIAEGTAGNAVTTTAAATGGHTTLAAGAATLAGGVNPVDPFTVPGNDNSSVPNVTLPDSTTGLTTTISGGAGICTNPGVPGQAFFATDVPFSTAVFPGLTTANGTGTGLTSAFLVPSSPDAVWEAGTVLTLRVQTGPTDGSISNLVIGCMIEPEALSATFPAFPNSQTAPANIPVPTVDF